ERLQVKFLPGLRRTHENRPMVRRNHADEKPVATISRGANDGRHAFGFRQRNELSHSRLDDFLVIADRDCQENLRKHEEEGHADDEDRGIPETQTKTERSTKTAKMP